MMTAIDIENANHEVRGSAPDPDVPTVTAFNMKFSNINFSQLCDTIKARTRSGKSTVIFTPNVDHVVRVETNSEFARAYAKADLSIVDGTPLMWALSHLGKPIAEKLSGSDMVPALSAWAAKEGLSVFLCGAAPGVAEEAAAKLCADNPGLKIVGTYSPPLGFEQDPEENAKTINMIKEAKPDLLFAALGSPKQEQWLMDHRDEFGPCASMGVGATLDFIAGRVQRAPRWMQRSGVEWVWRLCQEPRRLWRRYLLEDSAFLILFLKAWIGRT